MKRFSHIEPAYASKAEEFVLEFGRKIGGLVAIAELIPKLRERILEMLIYRADQEYDGKHLSESSVVRSSHPNDMMGLVDVLLTQRTRFKFEVASAVERIREDAKSPQVMAYARYENPSYDGNVTIAIQPDNGYSTGDIIEHPNQPGKYLITWQEGEGRGAYRKTGLYDKDGKVDRRISGGKPPDEAEQLVDIYRQIRKADIMRDDLSFQMEFGGKPDKPMIYQIRGFAMKEKADWQITDQPKWLKTLSFGVTPEEGIVLPVRTWDELDNRESPPQEPDEDWVLHKLTHPHEHSLNFRPSEHMVAYMVGRQEHSSGADANLQHGHFRLAQKVPLTLYENVPLTEFPRGTEQLRIRSDGVLFTVDGVA